MGDGQTVCPQIWGKRKNQNLHLLAAVEVSLIFSVFFGSDCETVPPSHHLIWQWYPRNDWVTMYLSSSLYPTSGSSLGRSHVSSRAQGLRRYSYPANSHILSYLSISSRTYHQLDSQPWGHTINNFPWSTQTFSFYPWKLLWAEKYVLHCVNYSELLRNSNHNTYAHLITMRTKMFTYWGCYQYQFVLVVIKSTKSPDADPNYIDSIATYLNQQELLSLKNTIIKIRGSMLLQLWTLLQWCNGGCVVF